MAESNLLLQSLSKADAAVMNGILKPVYLEQRKVLFDAGDTIDTAFFPTDAIISLVVGLSSGDMVEAAMVGCDGMVGGFAAMDGKLAMSRAIVQISGGALTCDAQALKRAALQSEALLSVMIRHEQTVFAQAQQSAACIASHHVEERLCRWMLRARDLSGSDTLPFTQEFLAEMIGVQRSSVSGVAHTLQQAGLIKYTRGRIQILDLDGLQQATCECYATVRSHYAALLGKESGCD